MNEREFLSLNFVCWFRRKPILPWSRDNQLFTQFRINRFSDWFIIMAGIKRGVRQRIQYFRKPALELIIHSSAWRDSNVCKMRIYIDLLASHGCDSFILWSFATGAAWNWTYSSLITLDYKVAISEVVFYWVNLTVDWRIRFHFF